MVDVWFVALLGVYALRAWDEPLDARSPPRLKLAVGGGVAAEEAAARSPARGVAETHAWRLR